MKTDLIISILCAVGGFVICYLSYYRGIKKSCEEEGKQAGQVMGELGYIKANTDDIKAEQREQRKINIEMYSRLTAVESLSREAHKRIDCMEERGI